ncbi:MAG: AsmA-like C-terminal region-containing protein [Flavobacteriaceae bacterium]
MKKKVLRILAILVLLIVVVLIAAPFFLEAKIGDIIKNNVNNNVNATLDFKAADLSLITSFPNAKLGLKNVSIVNNAPFEGDTLFAGEDLSLTMGIGQLFKGANDPIAIKNLAISGAKIHVIVNEKEVANYEIAKDEGSSGTKTGVSESFSFDLQSYTISESRVIYDDRAAKVYLDVSDIEHSGKGDLSANASELDTNTEALVSFALDSANYLNNNVIKLDAIIGIDLIEDTYTFKKNEAFINQLPLVFEGFVKVNEDNQEVNLNFKTPSSDFKNFLAVIPQQYTKNIENVKTSGNFTVEGQFNGIVDEEHIPKFDIGISSENASFKYPDLPKSVTNINIDVEIKNTTGIMEDTFVDIRKATFNIDEDRFNLTSKITELLGNTVVNAHVDGKMNLANVSKAYPIPADMDLKGILTADISTAFDMASIEQERYENTKTQGALNVKGFEYNSPEMANPVLIDVLAMNFNPKTVDLTEMSGITGQTDFKATGQIKNLLGFLFNDEKVKGNFDLNSETFALNDFMVEEVASLENEGESEDAPTEEQIKIPSFLDANIDASANNVLYDNLVLKDVRGNLKIKDEKASLSNMSSSVLDGRLTLNGEVSTKETQPLFAMQLGMKGFKIGEAFKALELFEVLAPIANILEGKLNSTIAISGNLENDFTPDLQTITGNVLAEVLATDINPERAQLLSNIGSKLSFLKTEKLNLKGLKTALSFENGTVKVKPFTINYDDIAIRVDGGHSFDKKLNYTATLDVPARYLGSEVNSLIAKIDEKELEQLTIPVTANIGGGYVDPVVSTDLTSGIKDLTTKLLDIQKQKMINQGKDAAKGLIGGLLSSDDTARDSVAQKDTNNIQIKDVLGGVLAEGSKKQDSSKADSVATEKNVVEEKAKDILGGLFGKKKKEAEAKKDSVN